MSSPTILRTLSGVQCLVCENCTEFKRLIQSSVFLSVCGICRKVISTCADETLKHAREQHADLGITTIQQLARRHGDLFVIYRHS